MKVFIFITSIFYLWTISICSAKVIENDIQEYEGEINSAQNFLSSFFSNMFQQPKIIPKNALKKVRVIRQADPVMSPNCDHYMAPNFCPICIFRMRRSHKRVPDNTETWKAKSGNKSDFENIKITTKTSPNMIITKKYDPRLKTTAETSLPIIIRGVDNNIIVNQVEENISNRNIISNNSFTNISKSKNISASDERIVIKNLKSSGNSNDNSKVSVFFQNFLNSWKRGNNIKRINKKNDTARFL